MTNIQLLEEHVRRFQSETKGYIHHAQKLKKVRINSPMQSTVSCKVMLAILLNPELFVADAALGGVAEDEEAVVDDVVVVELADDPSVDVEDAAPLDDGVLELLG